MSSRFGAYEILHELKSGGMGAVLLGRRRGPGTFEQLVAIKTIRAELAGAEAVRAMFLDEAAILARINHPGIATVHDFGEEAGTLYMVMEYVAGNSLRASLDDGERMPPGVAARAIADAARALHAAHEARDATGAVLGVVHRDVSPDNVMLGFDGHVKVIDFGIALIKNRQSPVTEFGTVKGKPPYMSPEQVKNEPIDRRSDIFSLGVVLYELLTGQQLFEGDSMYAIAFAVSTQPIVPPSQVIGSPLPAGLDAAVMHALERDPDKRTQTAAQLAEELERVAANAGDESLAAWAERELATPRDSHRSWLAKIVTGTTTVPRSGRSTGELTQVGPRSPVVVEAPVVTDEPVVASRRSVLLPIIALLVLAAGVTIFMLVNRDAPRDAKLPIDAAVIIAAVDAVPVDVAPVDVPEVDAALPDAAPLDAGHRIPVDAGRSSPRDAAMARPIDAAPQASGTGLVTYRSRRGTYATVVVDGKGLGTTPIFKRPLSAGHHKVEFIDPTGEQTTVVSFDLAADETKNVTQPD